MIHYIYKIHFLCGFPSGRYYIGRHTHKGNNLSTDRYTGSGNFCKAYFKKYGKKEGITYIKEILEINPSKPINLYRENIVIGDLWKTDPLCMNLYAGGTGKTESLNTNQNKSIKQYDLTGKYIRTWNSIKEAELYYKITGIGRVCAGKLHTSGGYIWRFLKDPLNKFYVPSTIKEGSGHYTKINQYTKEGKYIRTWNSIKEAALFYSKSKKSPDTLSATLTHKNKAKTFKGYQWRYFTGNTNDITSIKYGK